MKFNFLSSKTSEALSVLLVITLSLLLDGIAKVSVPISLIILVTLLRDKSLKSLGFSKPKEGWLKTIGLGFFLALSVSILYLGVLNPVVENIFNLHLNLSEFEELKGNLNMFLFMIPFVWIIAAFGEEILFRGFIFRRLILLFGEGKVSIAFCLLSSSIIFGVGHNYQGTAGSILSGCVGLVLCLIYRWRKYNIWINIVTHGFIDTIAISIFYFGWNDLLF